jgi:hypothetical protein
MALSGSDKAEIEKIVAAQIQPTNNRVEELVRLLKGSNGTKGLVVEVALIAQQLTNLDKSLQQYSAIALEARQDIVGCKMEEFGKMARLSSRMDVIEAIALPEEEQTATEHLPTEKKDRSEEFGGWVWFRDKAVWPILFAITLYVIMEIVKILLKHL